MMTTLQIVLAIVGVSLIAIIVLYNVLQERKFRKEADRMFSHKREDIMLGESVLTEASRRRGDSRIQLTDDAATAPEARRAVDEAEAPLISVGAECPPGSFLDSLELLPEPAIQPVRPAPKVEAEPPEPSPPPLPEVSRPAVVTMAPEMPPAPPHVWEDAAEAAAPRAASPLDSVTEYIARLKFATPQAANLGPLLASLRRIGKPVRAYGERSDGAWEPLSGHPRNVYGQVEFALQIADRGGAVSQDQLDAFRRALYEFAAEEGGAVTCPDREETLRLARDLDLFCMDVDILIGLNVVSADSRPFTSEAMHSLAQEARLSLEADGTFHARDDFGHTLFTLANQEDAPFPRDGRGLTTHGVTLLFDVPRVADGLAVFDRMTRLGFDLAWRLEGRLVDDNSRPVNEDSLNRDRARLAQFYARMEARGVPAGGERALRLFV
jgi:FtsZ-interacting cell division protein ZipA